MRVGTLKSESRIHHQYFYAETAEAKIDPYNALFCTSRGSIHGARVRQHNQDLQSDAVRAMSDFSEALKITARKVSDAQGWVDPIHTYSVLTQDISLG